MSWPTPRALVLLTLLACFALAAAWSAWVIGLVCGLVLLWLWGIWHDLKTLRRAAQKLNVHRSLPARGVQGDTVQVELHLESRAEIPLILHIQDGPPPTCPSLGDASFHRLNPGQPVDTRYTITLPSRGVMSFEPLFLKLRSPFGMLWHQKRISLPDEIHVFPPIWQASQANTPHLTLKQGDHILPQRGGNGDFDSLRPYVSGDDYRKLDWKATAKRGLPMVREYSVERNQIVLVGVDTGRWMRQRIGDRSKLDYALPAALQLARASVELSDTVGFFLYGAKVRHFVAPGRGLPHFNRMVNLSFGVQPVPEEPDYRAIFNTVLARTMRRAVIVLFTDFSMQDTDGSFARQAAILRPRHLPFFASISDGTLHRASRQAIASEEDLRIKAAARWTTQRTENLLATLRNLGCQVMQAPAQDLEAQAMVRFIELRRNLR